MLQAGYINALITSEQVPVRLYGSAGIVPDIEGGKPVHKLTGKFWLVVGEQAFTLSKVIAADFPATGQAFLKLRGRGPGGEGVLDVNMLSVPERSAFVLFTPGSFDTSGNFTPNALAIPFVASAEPSDFDQMWEYLRILNDQINSMPPTTG